METNRRDQILDALLEALKEHGLQKVTLTDVGDRLGVSKSAIYHYFRGKSDMLRALLIRELGKLQTVMEKAAEGVPDPARKLEAILKARLAYQARNEGVSGWSLDNLLSVAPLAREMQPAFHDSERDLFASILRQGSDRGVFQVDDVDTMADILVSTLHSVEEALIMRRKYMAPGKAQAALVQLCLHGLTAR